LTTITQINQMKIEYSVPEKYSTQIRNGEIVHFKIEGSSKNYDATVMARESKVDELTRNLKIRALVKGDDPFLVPGTFARVMMILGENKNALMIPSSSIIPMARNKEVAVYRNGKAEFVKVITGIRDSSNVQIIDGLIKGDTVITSGLLFVKPDSKIKLSKIIN
ncbi:MAG: efflux RND transporter periplasmic adaptor subunit, partial [Chitinophagaceae bacterium]